MHNLIKYNFFGLLFALLLMGCSKTSTDVFVPNNNVTDTVWSTTNNSPLFLPDFSITPLIDSFECNDDDKYLIGDSLSILFPRGGCMTTNAPTSTIMGSKKVTFKFISIKHKGDMIREGISCVSNNKLLDIETVVDLELSLNGNQIFWNNKIPPIQIKIKDNQPRAVTSCFAGIRNTQDSSINWGITNNLDSVGLFNDYFGPTIPNKKGYLFKTRNVHWVAGGNNLNVLLPTTNLNVFLPLNFTNKNTLVYASLTNTNTVVRLLPNATGKSFTATNIPAGSNLDITVVSKIGNDYFLASQHQVLNNATPVSLSPKLSTKQQILNYLNNL